MKRGGGRGRAYPPTRAMASVLVSLPGALAPVYKISITRPRGDLRDRRLLLTCHPKTSTLPTSARDTTHATITSLPPFPLVPRGSDSPSPPPFSPPPFSLIRGSLVLAVSADEGVGEKCISDGRWPRKNSVDRRRSGTARSHGPLALSRPCAPSRRGCDSLEGEEARGHWLHRCRGLTVPHGVSSRHADRSRTVGGDVTPTGDQSAGAASGYLVIFRKRARRSRPSVRGALGRARRPSSQCVFTRG